MVGLGGNEVGDCTTALVKEAAQEVTEEVVLTNLWSLMKTSQPDMPNYL